MIVWASNGQDDAEFALAVRGQRWRHSHAECKTAAAHHSTASVAGGVLYPPLTALPCPLLQVQGYKQAHPLLVGMEGAASTSFDVLKDNSVTSGELMWACQEWVGLCLPEQAHALRLHAPSPPVCPCPRDCRFPTQARCMCKAPSTPPLTAAERLWWKARPPWVATQLWLAAPSWVEGSVRRPGGAVASCERSPQGCRQRWAGVSLRHMAGGAQSGGMLHVATNLLLAFTPAPCPRVLCSHQHSGYFRQRSS